MARRFLRALAINTALTPVVPLLLWCLSPERSSRFLWQMLFISAVFSNCIGLIFSLSMNRIWVATLRWNGWLAWSVRAASFFLIATLGTVAGTAILYGAGYIPFGDVWTFFLQVYRFALVVTAGITGVIALYETMKRRLEASNLQLKQKELERERAMKLATEATLASLESRIHPHFLFNTLNSVASMIPDDPVRAEKLLGQMSQLLRFSLDAPQAGLVPVERELKIVADYLEIEKTRLGDRLRYAIESPEGASGMVPPLSIQTLVENSIKYAVAKERTGGSVSVRIEPGASGLRVEVADSGAGFTAGQMIAGHGLDNLEARLRSLFPGHPGLRIGGGRVSFEVPH